MWQTWKIFWDVYDPKFKNEYTYSVTQNKWEYQIAAVFEGREKLDKLTAFEFPEVELVPKTYANSTFDPSIFSPIIWLSSSDIDGDGDTEDNPSDGSTISAWVNKGTLWVSGDPTITWTITYEDGVLNGYNSVVVDEAAWLLLNNSEITSGEIYYVLNKTNKAVGAGMRWVQEWYHIWPWHNCVDSVNINTSPEFYTNLSGGKKDPYFYSFYTDDTNYVFRTNGNNLGFSGPTNSIAGVTWAFNAAGHDVEAKSKKKWVNCSSAASSSADIAIGEIMFFDSNVYELTDDDRLMIEGYLAWQWGLEGKLPEDHPYKAAPPEWPADEGEVEVTLADSGVYVGGDYNGLIASTNSGSTYYVLAVPSIMTYDVADTDLQSIISNRKFVYSNYYNIPSSYTGLIDTMDGGFDFYSEYPLIYEGTREEIGSYSSLKVINEQVRYKYRSSIVYPEIEDYLDDHDISYLEQILGSRIWINPIKPYFCSEILESKFIYNIATEAGLSGDSSDTLWYGLPALTNEFISTEGDYDTEYHSDGWDGYIELFWDEDKTVGFIRIYNSIADSGDMTDGILTIYDASDAVLYTHTLWNTDADYLIDFDFQELWVSLQTVRKIRLETTGGNPLHMREIEVYVGENSQDGYYTVDSDGIGWLESYQVYCDMTTDGWGWTRVGWDFIDRWNFDNQLDPSSFQGYYSSGSVNNVSENTIRSDITPPTSIPLANVLRHSGIASSYYELYFDDIPNIEFTTEIRLWAWIKGTAKSPLAYTLKYEWEAGTFYQPADSTDTGTWRYETVRIPVNDVLDTFRWQIGRGIDASGTPIDVTGLTMELFYK